MGTPRSFAGIGTPPSSRRGSRAGTPRGAKEIVVRKEPVAFVAPQQQPKEVAVPIVALVEVPACPVESEPLPPRRMAPEVPEVPAAHEEAAPIGEIPELPGSPIERAKEEGPTLEVLGGPIFEGGRGVELEHFPIALKKRDTPSWLRWSEYNSKVKLVPVSTEGIKPTPLLGSESIYSASAFKPRPD